MVVGVVCWVVVGGAVGCWVDAGILVVVGKSFMSCLVGTVAEGPGLRVEIILVSGSWSEISKSTEALAVKKEHVFNFPTSEYDINAAYQS